MTPQKDNQIQYKRLATDGDYFTNVFKRIEKLLSVIFYILSHIENKKDNDVLINVLKDKALATHEVSLATLRLLPHEAATGINSLQHALVSLESTLRLLEASGTLPPNIALLIFEQLITIERYLANNYQSDQPLALFDNLLVTDSKSKSQPKTLKANSEAAPVRRRQGAIPKGDISSDAYMVYSQLTDRADRIKTVLEAKPQATIKDISEIITDVSEKTIQRELNSLIEKGQVVREGERRWSKYSVSK